MKNTGEKYDRWMHSVRVTVVALLAGIASSADGSGFAAGAEASAETVFVHPDLSFALPLNATAQTGTLDWSLASTWSSAVVPSSSDDVIIPAGSVITISGNAACNSLTIDAGATLILTSGATLTVNGNFTNNGTLTDSGMMIAAGASSLISGSSPTTFNKLVVNAGTNVSSVVQISSDVVITNLSLLNGTLQVTGGTTTVTNGFNIPASSGIAVSAGATLNTGNYTINNKGLIRIDGGTANFGTAADNHLTMDTGGALLVSSGVVTIAGGLQSSAAGTLPDGSAGIQSGVTVTGGTITVAAEGNSGAIKGSFDVDGYGYFNFAGGTIVFENAGTGGSSDLSIAASASALGTKTINGGTFIFGNANTAAGEYFTVSSSESLSSVEIYNQIKLELDADLVVSSSFTAGSGSMVLLHDYSLTLPVKSSSLKFPLVDSKGNTSTVSLSSIVGTGGSVTLSMHESKHPNGANSTHYLNRYWEVETTGVTSYNLTALYPSSALIPSGSTYTNLVSANWDGSDWTTISTVGSTSILVSGVKTASLSLAAIEKPTAQLTGDATICAGTTAALAVPLTGAPNWDVVYTDGTSNYTLTGIASGYTFQVSPATSTTYTLVSVSDANIAGTVSTTPVTVTVSGAANGGSLSGGTVVCSGSNTTLLTLSGYTGSVSQWEYSVNGGVSWIAIANTTDTYTASNLTTDTRYRVQVQNAGCSPAYSTESLISVSGEPDATIAGTASVCLNSAALPVTFTATTGVAPFVFTYRVNGGAVQTVGSGTSQATVSQSSALAGAFVYELLSVADAGSCSGAVSGQTATVTVLDAPVVFNVTGGATFCAGTGSSAVGLSGSENGVMYQLYRDGIAVGAKIVGTGSAISFPNQSTAGTYTVVAANASTTCSRAMNGSAVVSTNPLPAYYSMTGGGSFCEGDAGVVVGMAASESGLLYQLFRDGVAVGSPVTGTGSAFDFGVQTVGGSYTVVATNPSTGCTLQMSGVRTVTENALPTATLTLNGLSAGTVTIVSGQSATLWITFTGSGPFTYSLNGGAAVTNTGNPEKIVVSPTSTTQYFITSLTGTLCGTSAAELTSKATVVVSDLPALTSPLSAQVCSHNQFSYQPVADVDGCTFRWERLAVSGISNLPRTGNGPINEILYNTSTAAVVVPYTITIVAPDGQEVSATMSVTVYPQVTLSYAISSSVACEGETITIQASSTSANVTYSLAYSAGSYAMQGLAAPTFAANTTGTFSLNPVPGVQVYSLSATAPDGCSVTYDIPVKIYDQPKLKISPSCFERSVSMSADMNGSTDTPLNFPASDLGEVEYSYDGGKTWTTESYYGPGLSYGTVSVLGRNSKYPQCSASISAEIGFASAFAEDVSICQGGTSESMTALSLCVEWKNGSHITKLNPDASSTYIVSSQDYTYSAGDEVAYAVSEIFKVEAKDEGFTFNDCNQKNHFSYSLYQYPFDPSNPSKGFLRLIPVGAACPKITISNLDPNGYYQLVINDYDLNSKVDVNIQFNENDKPLFINKTYSQVSWYDETGALVHSGDSFDPVAAGVIPDTNTPGDWSYYVSCGTDATCREEVHFTIYPAPTAVATGPAVTCSGETTYIRLTALDLYGNAVDPSLVSYTWVATNPDGRASGYTSCSAGCGAVILDPVVNTTNQEAVVYYTITPHSGDCPSTPVTFVLRVQPIPNVSVTNSLQVLCPSDDPQIAPITLTLLNSVTNVSFVWTRTNADNFVLSPAPPVIAGSGSGLPDAANQYSLSGQLVSRYPNSLQTTQFDFEVQVAGHTCAEKTAVITIGDQTAPQITCPDAIEVECFEDIPAGVTSPDAFAALDSKSAVSDNCTAFDDISVSYSDQLLSGSMCNGAVQRTYRATDYAGNYAECVQEIRITDSSQPSFVTVPAQSFSYCVHYLVEASHNGLPEPDTDIAPNRPDYHVLTDAEKQALAAITFTDNCGATLFWSLYDSSGKPVRDDNSDTLAGKSDPITNHEITLQGDDTDDRHYTLYYWLVDGCGNLSSKDYVIFITVTPRPEIIRMNDSAYVGN